MTVDMDIKEIWIQQTAVGDKEAFRQLYNNSYKAVYAYALSVLRHVEEAEDAAQETYLKIREAARLYRPQGKPMAWILTITRNLCLTRYRANRHISDTPVDSEDAMAICDPIGRSDDRLFLDAAFSVLNEDEAQIIVLHAVSGLKHREIGSLMGLPLATVLSKYRRGIEKIRRQMSDSSVLEGAI